jgi:hypothetical protein
LKSEDIITLEEVRRALSAAGDPWIASKTRMSSLSLSDLELYTGIVTPPVGEPTIDEIERRWRSQKSQ